MHVPTSPNGTHPNGRTPSPGPGVNMPPGADAKPPAADGGRDTHGRFAKGNLGGPGNPFARQVAALRRTLLATVTEEDLEAVTQELVRQAREGNLAAAKLLFSYALGKPAAPVDPDTLDAQEWEIYRRTPDPGQDFGALAGRMPLSFACEMARAMLPALAGDWKRQWADGFRQREPEERRQRGRDRADRLQGQEKAQPAAAPRPPSANGPDGRGRPPAPAQPPSANGPSPAGPDRGGAAADVAACNRGRPPG